MLKHFLCWGYGINEKDESQSGKYLGGDLKSYQIIWLKHKFVFFKFYCLSFFWSIFVFKVCSVEKWSLEVGLVIWNAATSIPKELIVLQFCSFSMLVLCELKDGGKKEAFLVLLRAECSHTLHYISPFSYLHAVFIKPKWRRVSDPKNRCRRDLATVGACLSLFYLDIYWKEELAGNCF